MRNSSSLEASTRQDFVPAPVLKPRSRVGRNRRKKIKPTVVVGSESPVPTPHQTGRTDFPYPAFRVQFSSGVTTAAIVSVGDFASTRLIPLQGLRPRPAADVWTSILPSLRSCYRRFFATMQDSDFQTDRCRLAGRTGLNGRLSFGLFLTHRLGLRHSVRPGTGRRVGRATAKVVGSQRIEAQRTEDSKGA